jgi:hypothetical protein
MPVVTVRVASKSSSTPSFLPLSLSLFHVALRLILVLTHCLFPSRTARSLRHRQPPEGRVGEELPMLQHGGAPARAGAIVGCACRPPDPLLLHRDPTVEHRHLQVSPRAAPAPLGFLPHACMAEENDETRSADPLYIQQWYTPLAIKSLTCGPSCQQFENFPSRPPIRKWAGLPCHARPCKKYGMYPLFPLF